MVVAKVVAGTGVGGECTYLIICKDKVASCHWFQRPFKDVDCRPSSHVVYLLVAAGNHWENELFRGYQVHNIQPSEAKVTN